MGLQRPPYVYMNGRITAWDEAKIHVGAEALIRGISVFEGIKWYWSEDGRVFNLLALRQHYERLVRSARLQYLPFEMTYDEFHEACAALVRELLSTEHDQWLRTTLFAVEGHWGELTITDLVITSYRENKKRRDPISVGVSTWQRPFDTALPARVKSAANYQVGRLARIEGRRQGFDDMILLNPCGRVAEASASCVLMVRNGKVTTPPPHEGCLESITVDIIEALCASLGIGFERRPIERTELAVADGLCLTGTLTEFVRIRQIEDRPLPESVPLLDRIADDFFAAVRGVRPHPSVELTSLTAPLKPIATEPGRAARVSGAFAAARAE